MVPHRTFLGASGGVPPPAQPRLRSCLDPLTPPSGRGRSPLHCHPSPWPAGRGSHHSGLLSCPGSSPARRWSASSHGGSADTGTESEHQGVSRKPQPAPAPQLSSPKTSLPHQPSGRTIRQQALETLQETKPSRNSHKINKDNKPW